MFVRSSRVQWDSLILKILRELQADAPLQGALPENQEVNWEPHGSEIPLPFELLLLEYSMTSPRSGQVQLQLTWAAVW